MRAGVSRVTAGPRDEGRYVAQSDKNNKPGTQADSDTCSTDEGRRRAKVPAAALLISIRAHLLRQSRADLSCDDIIQLSSSSPRFPSHRLRPLEIPSPSPSIARLLDIAAVVASLLLLLLILRIPLDERCQLNQASANRLPLAHSFYVRDSSRTLTMAKQFRRLASEHAAINSSPPPDYILPESSHDDLTILDAILVGPVGTPYEAGAFRISIKCTDTYPNTPPTANFKTKIWHPNVDEKSGEVCVDTLKTSWTPTTTLRDVLEVIRSLLIHPNPSSALNSEAGLLAEEDYRAFSRQAKLMTKIYAAIPADLKSTVKTMRQKADGEASTSTASSPAATTPPLPKHKKNPSTSSTASIRRPGSSSSTKRAQDDHPAALAIPPRDAHADNALHTPTKDHHSNPYTPTPTAAAHKDPAASSTRAGKENARVSLSPDRSGSSSPLGKRTFDEANEEGSLETDIRGEVDRSMSPPPAKRRSVEVERPEGLLMEKERPKKAPKSVVYSKEMKGKGKGSAPKGLKRL
ncbi:Ubiquitin-conjugating enzyme [Drechslerella dactyloides]|uniref:Ubiquitin-conjugating enzyme E2 2 n=1 Tax=Drechslerella dactyloides TaxID=74499 RepID=A0AAD6J3G9_DREDA|nr:Ubiquitin-conjugating enzyme [Drechslerella dactyloides]